MQDSGLIRQPTSTKYFILPIYRQPKLHCGTLATRLENRGHFFPGSKSLIHCAPDLVIDDQKTARTIFAAA
ncbi:hypothetical protein FFT88_04660 [Escherichia sp. E4930]|nr:hypothetical protein FFT88_04660 [Escherichia sp. E4930]